MVFFCLVGAAVGLVSSFGVSFCGICR
ncbi:Protein of unknown function [Bacillus mobilis]|nr:Protein of unknown function [Bacillus mobilis]